MALYALFVLVIIGLIGTIYFEGQKELELQKKRGEMVDYSNLLIERLRWLHINFDRSRKYPRDDRFQSAIFDSAGVEIFSTLKVPVETLNKGIYLKNGKIHFIAHPEAYYLGAKYVIVEIEDDGMWREEALGQILYYATLFLVLSLVIGYFLVRLFLRPLRSAVALLDRFIQDTTHELNTPLSTVLANIESIDSDALPASDAKKLQRIKIAAKTIANLYEDLTYLFLSHDTYHPLETTDFESLLKERIEYFWALANTKKIEIFFKPEAKVTKELERAKLAKIIDNLLSNAVKYGRIGGKIEVELYAKYLLIKDDGFGIPSEKLKEIFKRYARFESSGGGFGVGLSIVKKIIDEFGWSIDVKSKKGEGTEMRIVWEK